MKTAQRLCRHAHGFSQCRAHMQHMTVQNNRHSITTSQGFVRRATCAAIASLPVRLLAGAVPHTPCLPHLTSMVVPLLPFHGSMYTYPLYHLHKLFWCRFPLHTHTAHLIHTPHCTSAPTLHTSQFATWRFMCLSLDRTNLSCGSCHTILPAHELQHTFSTTPQRPDQKQLNYSLSPSQFLKHLLHCLPSVCAIGAHPLQPPLGWTMP